jgi:hypothetical protein
MKCGDGKSRSILVVSLLLSMLLVCALASGQSGSSIVNDKKLLDAKLYPEAEATFKKIVAGEPANQEAWFGLGEA